MRNHYQDMKAVFDRAGIAYMEKDGDISGSDDTVTLRLQGQSGIYLTFIGDDSGTFIWKLTECVTNLKENK